MKFIKKSTLESTCAPLLLLLRLVGIPLGTKYHHLSSSIVRRFYTVVMILVNMTNNTFLFLMVAKFLIDLKNTNSFPFSSTFFWNQILELLNFFYVTFGTHLALFATITHWPNFVRVAHRLDREFRLTPDHHKQFRFISIGAVLYLIFV